MRSLRWAIITYGWCPSKKGEFGQRHAHRENAVNMKAESPLMHLQVKAQEGLPANPQKLGERLQQILSERIGPADPWVSDFGAPGPGDHTFLSYKSPCLWCFVAATLGN